MVSWRRLWRTKNSARLTDQRGAMHTVVARLGSMSVIFCLSLFRHRCITYFLLQQWKILLKLVHICQRYSKNKTWAFFIAHGVYIGLLFVVAYCHLNSTLWKKLDFTNTPEARFKCVRVFRRGIFSAAYIGMDPCISLNHDFVWSCMLAHWQDLSQPSNLRLSTQKSISA